MAGIVNLFVDDLFASGGNEMEQRVLTRLGKYFQVGSQNWNDVAFTGQRIVGHKIPKTGRALKSVKTRLLMSWKRSQWNESRRKTSTALLRCIQCTEAYWDRYIGFKVGHSSNIATKFSDVLRWQPRQQLAMLSLLTNWRDNTSGNPPRDVAKIVRSIVSLWEF